jgi:hypothetical protein
MSDAEPQYTHMEYRISLFRLMVRHPHTRFEYYTPKGQWVACTKQLALELLAEGEQPVRVRKE